MSTYKYKIESLKNVKAYQQSDLPNNSNGLETFYGLSRNVVFCKRCLVSNQRPTSTVEFKNKGLSKQTIKFDKNSVCSACQFQEMKDNKINWAERERELKDLCDRFRKKNKRYDCLVPASGGKDSIYTAYILKTKYNMSPLTVTWSPHIYTEIGFKNLNNMINAGFDNILFTPNGKLHRKLSQLSFLNLCHPFQPFIIGQKLIGPKLAKLYDIDLIFYGENQAEYGNNIEENDKPTMDNSFYFKKDKDPILIGNVPLEKVLKDNNFNSKSAEPYTPLDQKDYNNNLQMHYLSYYLKWDPQENYYFSVENANFEPNDMRTEGTFSRYSSIDDKMDPLHYYTTFIKFGIGRATYEASFEIRTSKINREEGLYLVKKYEDEFPSRYFSEILNYLNISEEDFFKTIDNARSPHLWKFENNNWILRHSAN